MELKISPVVIKKIMTNSPNGQIVVDELYGFTTRRNISYTRGILHGYLLCLTTQGIIEKCDALEIMMQLVSSTDGED